MEDWNWETIFYGHYRSIFNHFYIISLPETLSNSVKKRKIGLLQRSRTFKVIEVGTNRKPVCDFLLVIILLNSNWHPSRTVSELLQLIVQILDTLRFWNPLGGLGSTYDVHLGLIGKRVVDFLLVLIELLLLGVMAEALRVKRDRNRRFRSDAVSLTKFQVQGVALHQSFFHG